MKGPLYALLTVSAALVALPAEANVYKCTINGETRYQDEPCPGERDAAPHLEFTPDPTLEPAPEPDSEPAPEPMPESAPEASRDNAPTRASAGNGLRPPPGAPPGSPPGLPQAPTKEEPRSEARSEPQDPERTREPRYIRPDRGPVPVPPDDDSPLDRTAELGIEIAAAEQALRAVVDERRDAMAAIDVRMAAGGNREALAAERKQLDASYRERRLEVATQLARLKAELNERCPNGTFQNVHRLACR